MSWGVCSWERQGSGYFAELETAGSLEVQAESVVEPGRSGRSLESQGWKADFDLPEQQLFVFELSDNLG